MRYEDSKQKKARKQEAGQTRENKFVNPFHIYII